AGQARRRRQYSRYDTRRTLRARAGHRQAEACTRRNRESAETCVQLTGASSRTCAPVSCTLLLTGRLGEVDAFVAAAAKIGELAAIARSGSVAVSKGEVTLSSYVRQHRLTG